MIVRKIKEIDSAKLYLTLSQIFFLGIGYLTQILLSKLILNSELFGRYQFINFLTNIFNILIASSIPIMLSSRISKNITKFEKDKELLLANIVMSILISIQFIVILIFTLILYKTTNVNLDNTKLIILCSLQVFTFGFMNITNFYIISFRKIKLFFKQYIIYILIKSSFIILSAYYTHNVKIILLLIIITEFIQAILNLTYIKLDLNLKKYHFNLKELFFYFKIVDVLTSNLLIYGITNLTIVIAYFGVSINFNEFNLYTLVYPWALIPFYLLSSLGNIYIVDFASGKENKNNIINILKKLVPISLILSFTGIITSIIFFYITYKEHIKDIIILLLLLVPSGIAISLISILISMHQGMGELHSFRVIIFITIFLYITISLSIKDLKTITLIGDIINFLLLFMLISQLERKI